MLSPKDIIIRKLAVDLIISERIIKAVVDHQFSAASKALINNKSIEISGFGAFVFNDKKAVIRMRKLKRYLELCEQDVVNPLFSEKKRKNRQIRIGYLQKEIEALKPRINEN